MMVAVLLSAATLLIYLQEIDRCEAYTLSRLTFTPSTTNTKTNNLNPLSRSKAFSVKMASTSSADSTSSGAVSDDDNTNKFLEDQLIREIETGNRLGSSSNVVKFIEQLEECRGIDRPAVSNVVEGRWRLIHTTNASTSSPIQRKAVDASKYAIYQDIKPDNNNVLIVSQVVKFSNDAELCVDALASTSSRPLPELTAREETGKILGLNILGVSLVGEDAKPKFPDRSDSRIDFVFDEGNFVFGQFKIPYPVPFRLPFMRDNVKGWIDITYLSDRLRISRGNKGTTFVLLKE
mmetsp:Transcript_23998/g.29475  ORF Transcript_23998/g.29475 Transcript_23998/m.29475 type:complete len:292 (+) Transcript_23998:261-1136(+)